MSNGTDQRVIRWHPSIAMFVGVNQCSTQLQVAEKVALKNRER